MTYQILNNDTVVKTIKAKGMNSIYAQFNTYAKKKSAVSRNDRNAIGAMVWVLPNGDVLSLFHCN